MKAARFLIITVVLIAGFAYLNPKAQGNLRPLKIARASKKNSAEEPTVGFPVVVRRKAKNSDST